MSDEIDILTETEDQILTEDGLDHIISDGFIADYPIEIVSRSSPHSRLASLESKIVDEEV